MKRILQPALPFILAMFVFAAKGQVFHVSKKGNDKNPGTSIRPLASLEAARLAIRSYKERKGLPKEGLQVVIHEGTYDLHETFVLNERDGGDKESPVIWASAPGEKVNITGGKTIQSQRFSLVKDKQTLKKCRRSLQEKLCKLT